MSPSRSVSVCSYDQRPTTTRQAGILGPLTHAERPLDAPRTTWKQDRQSPSCRAACSTSKPLPRSELHAMSSCISLGRQRTGLFSLIRLMLDDGRRLWRSRTDGAVAVASSMSNVAWQPAIWGQNETVDMARTRARTRSDGLPRGTGICLIRSSGGGRRHGISHQSPKG